MLQTTPPRSKKKIAVVAASVVALFAGVGTITGALNGVLDVVDRVMGEEDTAPRSGPDGGEPRSPIERISRMTARNAPRLRATVRHYREADRFIAFLRRHNGDVVELQVKVPLWPHGVDGESSYSVDGHRRNVSIRRKCPTAIHAGPCGVILYIFAQITDDALVWASDGHANLSGYFGVNSAAYGEYQMGYTTIRLKPLALG